MAKRKWAHKSACNNEKSKSHNLKIYKIIRENGGWDNWSMLLVEKFPCKDNYEACKREREVYEELEAKMNMVRPYTTQEETKADLKQYQKQYYQEHKAEYKEYHKQYHEQYREEHKAEIAEKKKEKIECEFCSKLLSKHYMSYHIKICKSKPVKE
jgi:alpha-galactosidase/6-phospho-beta-glucosidase family protein